MGKISDPTELIRREMVNKINANPTSREGLAERYGQVWDTQELGRDFEVLCFMAPMVVVKRKADSKLGSLTFQHQPRYYFDFVEDK